MDYCGISKIKLYVPKRRLRDVLLKECHYGLFTSHGGAKHTITFLKKTYYCLNLKDDAEEYMKTYLICQQIEHSMKNKQDCCDLYQFLKGRGKVCPWISWWVCHHQRDLMRSWWWWIDLARWHTSFPPNKVPWPKKRKGCFSRTYLNIMASPRTLCWIEIKSSQTSFGKLCGSAWGQNSTWKPHFNPKQMDKPREWTWLSNNSWGIMWLQINKIGWTIWSWSTFVTTIRNIQQQGPPLFKWWWANH